MMVVNGLELDEFTLSYLEAALWSSNDESDDSGGEPLDKNFQFSDITPESLGWIKAECELFQRENMDDILSWDGTTTSPLAQAGHDFWLTRNGHGCGFWESEWGDPGERLDMAAKDFGECYLFVDGLNLELDRKPERLE